MIDLEPPLPGYNRFIGSYLLIGKYIAIVDPGPTVAIPGLMSALSETGIKPEEVTYLILTHVHLDHAGGTGEAMKHLPYARVLAHDRALPHLINPENLWNASRKTLGDLALKYGVVEPIPENRIAPAVDGMKLDLGNGVELEIYWTPGHAIHHLSLLERSQSILIAGEAAGVCLDGSMRPATPPPFKLDVTLASVEKLITLKPQKLCYGHFGCYDDGVYRLRYYHEKLRNWHEIIRSESAKGRSPEEMLSTIRSIDNDLAYLEKLDKDQYSREFILLINTIYGMAGLVR